MIRGNPADPQSRRRYRLRLKTPAPPVKSRKQKRHDPEERARFEALFFEISARFVNQRTGDADAQITQALQMLADSLDVDQCYFSQFSNDRTEYRVTHMYAAEGGQIPTELYDILLNERYPWFTRQMLRGEPLILAREVDLPEEALPEREFWRGNGIRSALVVPSTAGGSLLCSIGLTSVRSERDWPGEMVQQLRIIAEMFASALARKRAEEALDERLKFEEVLSGISSRFVNIQPREVDGEIDLALQKIGDALGADRSALLQLSDDRSQLLCTHMWFAAGIERDPGIHSVILGERFPWMVGKLARGEIVDVPRVADLTEEARGERDYCRERGIQSFFMVPFLVGGSMEGAVVLDAIRGDRAWSAALTQRLRLVGDVLAGALMRKRAVEELGRTNERFQILLETTNAVPWVVDARSWRFTYVGPQAARLLGYAIEEWYEDDFWVDHIHPDDREFAVEQCRRSSARLKEFEFEYRMLAADGTVLWLHDIVSVESKQGLPRTLRGFLIDVSRRKLAEEALAARETQLRLITDALPVLIAYVDSEQRYLFNNSEYERAYGVSREDLRGRTLREVNGEEAYERMRPHVELALAGQRVKYEEAFSRPYGTVEHLQATYVPHVDPEGRVLGFFALVEDVTDRVRSAQEVQRHRDQLAHVSRVAVVGEMATGLAHEINQPLCAIVSNAQSGRRFLAAERLDEQSLEEVLVDIAADGKRASDIIQRLRTLLRRGELQRQPVDLNEACREVVKLVRRDALDRRVELRLDLAPSLPPVEGDGIQLQQVLLNLILNGLEALAAVEPESRRLTIATSCSAPGVAAVSVEDSGPGFLDEDVDRVFEPFVTTKPHGLGMGLSISRTIIESHSGRLWATRNPDRGATFQFALPCLRAEEEAAGSAEPEV